ncbi:conserved exported hypothetical protein [Bosea sp. 62]|uniref:hypothetical protein n=1 Tax=unclassified Bosea (in: a-proteobacteria) TaxID=2653178 RepID=UPI00125720EA|nr:MULTISPECIES: hypothetical protein [unclassified Bosea (in: a-proteobacteria)]CAD5286504.1 conserved exported hypothetical protein [Bosea sp. 21B]CAD5289058.1 conserved exported hypothetical protein [Bosea sp. 46]CAD5301262.1 conserved exported hypothetical protein [Bosea sp. 7B]VVT60559.1 conserved exported hypothetical protein [Bosea sp. EC-HK365B]VXB04857.1 conserved exported hypothetical protein [Bosea sp. 62]
MTSAFASLALGTLLALSATVPLHAQVPENWPQVKCERWRSAYDEALKRFGRKGLGQEFIAGNDAFIASGCQSPLDVCPRSAEELNFANVMVMAGMNARLSSTFMPYACRKS